MEEVSGAQSGREAVSYRGFPVSIPGGPTLPWPLVCVDFDGVLARYGGFAQAAEAGDPMPDAETLLGALRKRGCSTVVLSARPAHEIEDWLSRHGLARLVDAVTSVKVPAVAYLDDRAVRYRPDMSVADVMRAVFSPAWWEGNGDDA